MRSLLQPVESMHNPHGRSEVTGQRLRDGVCTHVSAVSRASACVRDFVPDVITGRCKVESWPEAQERGTSGTSARRLGGQHMQLPGMSHDTEPEGAWGVPPLTRQRQHPTAQATSPQQHLLSRPCFPGT